MPSTATKAGHLLAKVLRIDLNYRDDIPEETLSRGESILSVQTSDTFVEQQPTSAEWIRDVLPSGKELISYTRSLFPFTYWIGRYNLQWLFGDLVAGQVCPMAGITIF
jgi:sodium-independent sulfate anion transporter 11